MTPPDDDAAVFAPPWVAAGGVEAALRSQGYAVLAPAHALAWAGLQAADLQRWHSHWDDLPPDAHLRDGGRYRRRRHASMVLQTDQRLLLSPHRAHWQPLQYNALHGGIERWFQPLPEALSADPAWARLMQALAGAGQALRPQDAAPWFIEAHAFRIDTTDGIGRPTPEGAHRDGVDLVAVMLMGRQAVKGGETRVFAARGPEGLRFTLGQPGSLLLLDDARVIHETTPIQPLHEQAPGWRDTLVVTLRRGGFLQKSV